MLSHSGLVSLESARDNPHSTPVSSVDVEIFAQECQRQAKLAHAATQRVGALHAATVVRTRALAQHLDDNLQQWQAEFVRCESELKTETEVRRLPTCVLMCWPYTSYSTL